MFAGQQRLDTNARRVFRVGEIHRFDRAFCFDDRPVWILRTRRTRSVQDRTIRFPNGRGTDRFQELLSPHGSNLSTKRRIILIA